jgi:zinc/manganese transport system substrate-binding protein
MRKQLLAILFAIGITAASVQAKLNVVASSSDLASIANSIGGDLISVKYLVDGRADPHFVEVLPSYMVMVTRADVYLKIGLGLDFWAQPIIDGSRNGRLKIVDCSVGIEVLEKPTEKVNASMGDVHPQGNPHYWLDPANALVIAQNIANGLSSADPNDADRYRQGLSDFTSRLEVKQADWQTEATSLNGLQIITYHDSWPYFCRAFGIQVAGFIEPKPGIEPTASHTAELIDMVKARGIRLIGKEPYFSNKAPRAIAAATGAKVIDLPPSVGGAPGTDDYFSLIDTLLERLSTAAGGGQ